MVYLMKLQSGGGMAAVKTEIEDPLEDEHGPLNKRSKHSQEAPAAQYNPLDEPSPLGLRLRKSPSLLELIQMRLSQGSSPTKEQKGASSSGPSTEKLKASNFPGTILRIGTWEYKSRYEGDLVAKCYFAKHKLVWEVLDGGLKNKIEIQWSDIMGLKANYPEDEPGTLDVVLGRLPLFFRETNPQPRKHTLWQATSDFTGGQASIQRRHFLQCPQGLLGKHFEKLVQCDPRLNFLSHQKEIVLESPYFEPRVSVFDDLSENRSGFDLNIAGSPSFFSLRDAASPSGGESFTSRNENDAGTSRGPFRHETPSPSSVMDTNIMEEIKNSGEQWKELSNWDQIKVPGLHNSMSMSDLVSHLETRVSEQQGFSNNVVLSSEERHGLEILDEINRCMFSEPQYTPASDEKSLMTRVNSLCCLLQRGDSYADLSSMDKKADYSFNFPSPYAGGSKFEDKSGAEEGKTEDASGCKPSMTRKDSVGELLMNLPRIASLPQFLFNISEDGENQAR